MNPIPNHPGIILVGNYAPDDQQSMQRFADMLLGGLQSLGATVALLRPKPVLGRWGGNLNLHKWLGYADKFLLFRWSLRRFLAEADPSSIVHVCDQGNAMYIPYIQDRLHLITCHDLLAVRSALGQIPGQHTSVTGRQFQRMILAGLRRARRVVCVSDETQRQLVQLGGIEGRRISTIQNGLNYNYQRLKDPESSALLWEFPALQTLGERGFIFHVGGNQWYKNRAGVLRIYFEYVSQGGRLPLVMAGKPFTPELERLMVEGPSAAQVLRVGSVNNQQLNALYARAACLLFPSLQEGFGWPIVEAFAAGTRVVTTGAPPMNEIGGDVAVYIDPRNETAAGRALLELLGEPEVARQQREQRAGFWGQNFRPEAMLAAYQAVYAELAAT